MNEELLLRKAVQGIGAEVTGTGGVPTSVMTYAMSGRVTPRTVVTLENELRAAHFARRKDLNLVVPKEGVPEAPSTSPKPAAFLSDGK